MLQPAAASRPVKCSTTLTVNEALDTTA